MNISGKTAGEIFDQIRALIHSGVLLPGAPLPPVRELANKLVINRNTVALAYKRLTDAGFAVSRGRNGTVIRETFTTVDLGGGASDIVLKDLASGNPAVTALPPPGELAQHIHCVPGLYSDPIIRPDIEIVGLKWLQPDLPVRFELNLTNGSVDAVERILASYLIAGDRVAVEDPCFLSSISTLRHNRFEAAAVEVDEEGMKAEALSQQLKAGVQAVIITPRAHNPTGFGLSADRANQIRTLLSDYPHVLILIDDHFSVLSTNDYHHVIPDSTRNWALIRSTSKFLGPDLRLAFVASDSETSLRLRQRLNAGTNWVSHILQDMVAGYLTSSRFPEDIQVAQKRYYDQRELLVSRLKHHGINISAQHDGLNIWVPLKQNSKAIVMQMAQRGWLIKEGETFALANSVSGLRITISDMDIVETEKFAESLARVLTQSYSI